MMSVWCKQADELFRRRHAFAMKHPAARLIDDSGNGYYYLDA